MTDEVELEIYFPKGTHLGGQLVNVTDKGGIGILFAIPVEGDEFSQRYTVLAEFGERQFKLVLSWSPSRAGDERISWSNFNGEPIDATKHPLFGTKNEKGFDKLPAGCYVIREEVEV